MSTDKASSKTSELLDSVLRGDEGIERQNTLSVPLQKPFKDHPLRREARRCDYR